MINKALLGILFLSLLAGITLQGCKEKKTVTVQEPENIPEIRPTDEQGAAQLPATKFPVVGDGPLISGTVHPDSIVAFARTLIGVPYLYASTDPALGFDCSGFITYVFNYFKIIVPRSSVDFTNYGREIPIAEARPGDLILFTGTDSTIRVVGHMGIVESVVDNKLYFIHSTSGKAKGVVITPFENYYQGRFVKLIRVFPDEQFP